MTPPEPGPRDGGSTGGGRAVRLGGLLPAVVGVLLCVALWVPDPDREVLLAQGVAHVLAADLGTRAAGDAAGAAPRSLFDAADRLLDRSPAAGARATLRIDGRLRRTRPVERAIETQWNRYREARSDAVPPLRFGAEGASAAADGIAVELAIGTADGRVRISATLAHAGASALAPGGEGWRLPGRASLLPPLVALLVGLLLSRTLLALFVGVAVGATLLAAPTSGAAAPLVGLVDVFRVYLRAELMDAFRLEILGFIGALLALVGIVSRAGGLQGLIDRVVRVARSARSTLLLTYGMGLAIFFDDYANCVLVGNTMRPLTDRLRVSREKLAYVVDSTAAPVAAISLLSTWIAFQVSVYSAQLPAVGIQESGYAVFLRTLPFRFYCLLTLFFVFAVIVSRRDFGPMARAEQRARTTGRLVREGGRPPISEEATRIEPAPWMPRDWRVAAFPLLATAAVVVGSIFVDGGGLALLRSDPAALRTLPGITRVLLDGSGAGPLLDGALAGLLLACFQAGGAALRWGLLATALLAVSGHGPLAEWLEAGVPAGAASWLAGAVVVGLGAAVGVVAARLRPGRGRPHLGAVELARAGLSSARTLAFAAVLLLLAWMIGAVCRDLATADYLVALCADALPPALLPVLLFAVAGLVAFATGSSWSTMSILLPNVVALAAAAGEASALGATGMVALCISAVLEGAVFGDHCSPISDTTVLSSVAAGSDHLDHVRTQAPYALLTAAAAIGFGYAPLLWIPGWGGGLALGCGAAALWLALRLLGRRADEPGAAGVPLAPT